MPTILEGSNKGLEVSLPGGSLAIANTLRAPIISSKPSLVQDRYLVAQDHILWKGAISTLHLLVSRFEDLKELNSNFTGAPTVAYKMGLDSSGKPIFTQVGATAANAAGRVGIGMFTGILTAIST
jgi:hypothetical protein